MAISRGGFIPARLICDLLDINSLACIRIKYYSGINRTLAEPRIICPLNADAKNKRVLIVDDVADRGNTLMVAKKHVEEVGAREIRLATLHYKPWSKLEPDYYAREFRSWIVYPWEVFESIRKIFPQLLQEGKSLNEAKRQLSRIGITENEIRTALRDGSQSLKTNAEDEP